MADRCLRNRPITLVSPQTLHRSRARRSYRFGLRKGHAAAHNLPAVALTLINSAKTAAAAACPSVLRDAGLSGGTHFAALQITAGGSLSLRAATMREGLSWQARCWASLAAWQRPE